MTLLKLALVICLLSVSSYVQENHGNGQEAVRPYEFEDREDIISYLKTLGNGSYLFGQIATWVHNANPDMDHKSNWLRKVYDHTGIWPRYGCVTYDFDDNPYSDEAWNQAVKKMWDRGLIPGIYSWFANPSGARFSEHCDIDQIFADGSNPIKNSWIEQLDRMAANFRWLENEGIPVIYTPFVELDNTGKWFGTDGKENAIKLHRMIHDYFEKDKKLTNIIWAYHTGSTGRMKEFYPGDEYVDVMGHSVYERWGNPALDYYDYAWAVEKKKGKGKIIWIAELGINSAGDPPRDCFDVLRRLENDYPELAGFVFWSDDAYYNVIGNANGTEFMEDRRIITLE